MTKRISILFIVLAAAITAAAHHYEVANSDSVMIYYTDVTAGYGTPAVEVTYRGTWYGDYENEYQGAVNIPDSISVEGKVYTVIGIGEQAFAECYNLKSVTIPESIEYIRYKPFEKCYQVTEINYNAIRCADFTMPEFAPFSVNNMYREVYEYSEQHQTWIKYWNDYNVSVVNIGPKVERIPDYMFYGMGSRFLEYDRLTTTSTYTKKGVKEFNFLGVPKEIGNQAFRGCRVLRAIEIPQDVESLGQALFADCDTLASVSLPDHMEEIPAYFFMNCKELTNFVFPSQVKSINFEAFKNCAKLTDLNNLPAGLKVIGPSAFRACEFITHVDLPEGLVTLDGYSFSDCTGLTTLDIPGTVETIGNYAFEDCTNLTTVTLHEGTKEIGNFVFAGCRKLSKGIVNAPARMPRIYAQTFNGVANSMTVNVEGGDEKEYVADANWGRFFAPQGVEEIDEPARKAHKVIRDGQLIIKKGGKEFNVLGAEL